MTLSTYVKKCSELLDITLTEYQKDVINLLYYNRFSVSNPPKQSGILLSQAIIISYYITTNVDKTICIASFKSMQYNELYQKIVEILKLLGEPIVVKRYSQRNMPIILRLDDYGNKVLFTRIDNQIGVGFGINWLHLIDLGNYNDPLYVFQRMFPVQSASRDSKFTLIDSTDNNTIKEIKQTFDETNRKNK